MKPPRTSWPATREECERYIIAMEHGHKLNTWRWRKRYAANDVLLHFESNQPSVPAPQEEIVFLHEVIAELERKLGRAATSEFLDNCDGRLNDPAAAGERRTNTQRTRLFNQRRHIRAWAHEEG